MTKDLFSLSSYHFDLPPELIAQHPCSPRDHSRLMIVDRKSGSINEMVFHELSNYLQSGDHLIFNDTKVLPVRLLGTRPTGGVAEIFLVRRLEEGIWEVLARPGRKLRIGAVVNFGENFSCEVIEILPDGNRHVRFSYEGDFEQALMKYGQMPLPHYIKREEASSVDLEDYQTVYAANPGAAAAPTAGLHFTRDVLQTLATKGINQTTITLHVGLGTFKPVQTEDIREHHMHTEQLVITPAAAERINTSKAAGKRQICVGTTTCRTRESVATAAGEITAGNYSSNLFIYPGYQFKFADALLTNFHFPESSLLMMVSAFGGYELIREAYVKAIEKRFRFFSYGDAMLIV